MQHLYPNPSVNTVYETPKPGDIAWGVLIENFTPYTLWWTSHPNAVTKDDVVKHHEGVVSPFSISRVQLPPERASRALRFVLDDNLKVTANVSTTWVKVMTLGEEGAIPVPGMEGTGTTPIIQPVIGGGGGQGLLINMKFYVNKTLSPLYIEETVPSNARFVIGELIGAGGGGQGGGSTPGNGGGAGGFVRWAEYVTANSPLYLTLGAGGAGGAAGGGDGTDGGMAEYSADYGQNIKGMGGGGGTSLGPGIGGSTGYIGRPELIWIIFANGEDGWPGNVLTSSVINGGRGGRSPWGRSFFGAGGDGGRTAFDPGRNGGFSYILLMFYS